MNASQPDTEAAKNSHAIHREAICIDMHADTVQRIVDEGIDINTRLADGHLDAVRLREGGVDAQFFAVWVQPQFYGSSGRRAIERADTQIAAVRRLAEEHPETWTIATSADDIRRAAQNGKLAALIGLEGGYALDGKLENVERYYQMGVRYMSPTWSVSLPWAGSSGDATGRGRGLNEFGRQVVREMNRLGMMVDVSHVSDKTFWDIAEVSTKPILATHSGVRAIANVRRNLTDDMIRRIAHSGGVVCVVFYPAFLEPDWEEQRNRVDAKIMELLKQARQEAKPDAASQRLALERVREREYATRLSPVSIARVADHIDHIVRLVGIDHVGLGSDFDGIQATPRGLTSVADMPNLTVELATRGYSEVDIKKILGGNVLRVMEEVMRPEAK